MAETAACSILSSSLFNASVPSFSQRSAHSTVIPVSAGKRKTPSELRLEQLKRLRTDQDEQIRPAPSSDGRDSAPLGPGKPIASKPPRFIDTRVADIYAATKPGDRPKLFAVKGKQKDVPFFQQQIRPQKQIMTVPLTAIDAPPAKSQWNTVSDSASADCKHDMKQGTKATNRSVDHRGEDVPYCTFRNVTELSTSVSASTAVTTVDMDKVLKGMAHIKTLRMTNSNSRSSHVRDNSAEHELLDSIKSDKIPLDLSLKTSMRLISSKSFQWCHRVSTKDQYSGLQDLTCSLVIHGKRGGEIHSSHEKGYNSSTAGMSYWKSLHSWVHPQCVLPPLMLSALASAAARGGTGESAFLSKRQQTWEDSFRSLYYMFRNKLCDLFYFSTQQFLVMFISGGIGRRKLNECSAYLTRSSRGLRGLLKEQDITFSMPLCPTQVGTTTVEELLELTEFEKTNPGQTRLVDSMAAVDNSMQSLLAFNGSKSVHSLYDFLLNNRSLLYSTTGADVPLLLSSVPFENAALVMPEVSCKEMQRGDSMGQQSSSRDGSLLCSDGGALFGKSFSLEIKGTLLPPWVVCGLCSVIEKYHSDEFEVRFVTDPLSEGLNVAQETSDEKQREGGVEPNDLSSIAHSAGLQMGVVKQLWYSQASYTASIATI